MDRKFLTPSAQRLLDERESKKDICLTCDGRGTNWEDTTAGIFERICFVCHGTGKNQILGIDVNSINQ